MSDHVSSTRSDAPRRVDLAIARIDAWTVMKVSFLLSVALGIAMVVATIVLWLMVDAMHVFSQLEEFLKTMGAGRYADLLDYARLPRVISYATIVAVINVVLLTALSTLGAMLYNVVASLVGGVTVSLMDERGHSGKGSADAGPFCYALGRGFDSPHLNNVVLLVFRAPSCLAAA